MATAGLTSQGDVASFVAGLTLASGLLFLLLAVLKMGWVAQFLSRAVVTGFLFGAARHGTYEETASTEAFALQAQIAQNG